MKRIYLLTIIVLLIGTKAIAQNPLPDFVVEDVGNGKVRIGWVNPYGENCIQLMVQTSFDSSKSFKTIFATESPQLPQNGFVFNKQYPSQRLYFRIFYILTGNAYYFTASKKPAIPALNQPTTETREVKQSQIDPMRTITVRTKDSVVAQLKYSDYFKFKDSVNRNTKDTLFVLAQDQVLIKPYNPENYFRPSLYVATNRDGFITLKIPDALEKTYKIIFFTMDNKKIFTINHVHDTEIVLDKTNFMHAGWFKFELYEDNKLKEKNKVLLQRDF